MYEVIKDKFLYYFAYGANMNQNQILKRCLRPEFISAAFLPHHKLEFFGYSTLWDGGVETLVSEKTQDLWGAVYKLSFFDIERLDTWQNVKFDGTGPYFSSPETVFDQNGRAYSILLYKKDILEKPQLPSQEYLNFIITGAESKGLPADYLACLRNKPAKETDYPLPLHGNGNYERTIHVGGSCRDCGDLAEAK